MHLPTHIYLEEITYVKTLSPPLEQTLFAIHKLTIANGYQPSQRELMDELGISQGTICWRIRRLKSLGWIRIPRNGGSKQGHNRSIEVCESIEWEGVKIPVIGEVF